MEKEAGFYPDNLNAAVLSENGPSHRDHVNAGIYCEPVLQEQLPNRQARVEGGAHDLHRGDGGEDAESARSRLRAFFNTVIIKQSLPSHLLVSEIFFFNLK